MESMLRRLLATWIKSQELAPRRSPTAAVRCESLEGRQLLSTTGLLRGHMGMPSSPTTQRGQFFTRGTMGGQNTGGFGSGAAVSSVSTQAGPFANIRGHGNAMGGGAGRGGVAVRYGQVARARLQNQPATPGLNAVVDTNTTTVPSEAPETLTMPAQGDPANGSPTTTQPDQGAPTMSGGSFSVMPSGPLGGWFGGRAENRELVSFNGALGQQADGPGTQAGNLSIRAEPSEELQSHFEKLQTDLQAIQDKSEVTPKLLAAVRNDFEAIQEASTTDPDQESVKALAATVESIGSQIPTDVQQAQLVADFTAVLKSQGITDQTLIDTAVADIQAVVAASHVTADDLATIAADREAIENEINSNAEAMPSVSLTTGDAVGSLMSGLTGGFESGIPMAVPFAGGAPGGPFSAFPIDFASAGGVMMDGGGQFNGLPITVSPIGGGMHGPISVSQGAVNMAGGGQFGSFSVSSASGVEASGQFSGAPVVTSYTVGGMGGQSAQFSGSPYGGGMGGRFGGRRGR
ncbi:hypothetical protein V5E97_10000 [Singulisphaera sp. Ch08]|uniref:Uncharacterized protein n=1 Tax=Singulisphaera sp. Ch08 TaxID=3120278 RepID=A0AAU7CML9_9BACT